MKRAMLLALPFIQFALTTIAMFSSGAVLAQPPPPTVLDIYGEPVLTGAEYYIYEPRGEFHATSFRVTGLLEDGRRDCRVYLYDDCEEPCGIPVIISQGNRSKVVVDTAFEIKFNIISNFSTPPYWKLSLEPEAGNYFATIGGYNEGYKFMLAQKPPSLRHHLYYLTYTPVSPFCYNATTVAIGLLDSYFVAHGKEPFQFTFVPVENPAGIRTPLLKLMDLLRTMY